MDEINIKIQEEAVKQFLNGVNNIASFDVIFKELNKQGWAVHPVYFKNKIVGAIVEKEGIMHTSISPEYQRIWNPRTYIKSILYPALVKFGVLYSDAAKDDPKAIRWLTKLGFSYIREDSERVFYVLKELPLKYRKAFDETLRSSI